MGKAIDLMHELCKRLLRRVTCDHKRQDLCLSTGSDECVCERRGGDNNRCDAMLEFHEGVFMEEIIFHPTSGFFFFIF